MKSGFRQLPAISLVLALVLAPDAFTPLRRAGDWLGRNISLPASLTFPLRYAALMVLPAPARLPVPVEGVASASLTDSFGEPRSGHRKHQGTDIFARRNTPVHSTTDGIISRRGTNKLGGLIISVAGPGGQVHYYAHLERYGAYKLFDSVKQGDVIGYVGNSGNAGGTPPRPALRHLYGFWRDKSLPAAFSRYDQGSRAKRT